MYFCSRGVIYPWLQLYIRSDYHTGPTTTVRCKTTDILGNTIIRPLTGTPGFQVTPIHSWVEAMRYLIIDILASAYNMKWVLLPPGYTYVFLLDDTVVFPV